MSKEEVKKILTMYGVSTHFSKPMSLEACSQAIVKLFSPPPVDGDVRERIIDFFWKLRTGAINTENMNLEEQDVFKSDSILSIIEKAEYAKLDKDQTLPEISAEIVLCKFPLDWYKQAQRDMLNANWRKIA